MNDTTQQPDAFDQTALGSVGQDCAHAQTGLPNEGGIAIAQTQVEGPIQPDTPRLVIRGESPNHPLEHSHLPSDKLAFVDWLNFTFDFSHFTFEEFRILDDSFLECFGFGITGKRPGTFLNYDESYKIGSSGGIFAFGGTSVGGTAIVSLPGKACMEVKDWHGVYQLLVSRKARITRVDLTHDDIKGVYSIPIAMELYDMGGFTSHGRKPCRHLHDDFNSGAGKTFEVGSRNNGKLLRVYEKGKKEGDPNSPWVRWELELRNISRVIPHDTVIHPGKYLAGSYPCMTWINQVQSRIKTVKNQASIRFAQQVRSCRNSYGPLIHLMHEGLGYDPQTIIEELSRKGIPHRISDLPNLKMEDS